MKSGKDLVLSALHFEKTERTPWVPFTGVQVARLLDMDAEAFLKSSDAIVHGVIASASRYRADGVCSVFDLQVEAEVLGCKLKWSKKKSAGSSRTCSGKRRQYKHITGVHS